VVNFTFQLMYLPMKEKNPQFPLDGRLGGPWGQSGYGGKEKKIPSLPGIKFLSHSP